MTNLPDRVWVVVASDGGLSSVHRSEAYATADSEWCEQSNPRTAFNAHEYRLHHPIPWRTGVPDAETRRQCKSLFALLLPDGSALRECVPQHDGGWWWGGAGAGEKFIDPEYLDMRWCPEDEMPKGGT